MMERMIEGERESRGRFELGVTLPSRKGMLKEVFFYE